jgi:predicted ATPase
LQGAHADGLSRTARQIAERYYDIRETARDSVAAVYQLIDRWAQRER